MFDEALPELSPMLWPPVVQGAAAIAEALAQGTPVATLLERLSGPFQHEAAMLSAAFDTAVLSFLSARRDLGLALQRDVLSTCRLFRIADGPLPDAACARSPLRLLAFAAQGDLQMNTPIEFITRHLDVRLDIVFVLPGERLPAVLPDHDVAICIVSDSDPDTLMRLAPVLARWRRPVLNNPARFAAGRLEDLTRDGISRLFAHQPGITAPETVSCTRAEIADALATQAPLSLLLPGTEWPILARPVCSHAGALLERLEDAGELSIYLASVSAERLYLSRFVDYRGADGLHRKYRVALIEGRPFLCHMAVSDHWMIHYLNAGMEQSPAKRQDEAAAMATFDDAFAQRHASAFQAIVSRLGLDHVILDCGETQDGRLLLFEVEMAAIIHLLDPIEMFAYKQPQMRRVFAAFETMLLRAASRSGGG